MANLLFVKSYDDGTEEEIEVPEQYVSEARRDPTLSEAAEFKKGDNVAVVKKRDFKIAISEGWKPTEDPSFLSALGRGLKSGVETAGAAAGFGARSLEEIGTSAEEELAFADEPVAYGIGKTLGIVGPTVISAKGAMMGGRPIVRAAAPSAATRQRFEAAKEGFETKYKAPAEGLGVLQKATRAFGGAAEAARTYKATARTQRAVAKFGGEGGGGEGGKPPDFINFIDPGETPEKKYVAGRAATIAPSRYKEDDLNRFLSMGTEERQKALQFNQLKEAEKFVPELQSLFDGLEEGRGATFRALQERASKQFWPAFANEGKEAIKMELSRVNKLSRPSAIVVNALNEARDAIEKGETLDPRAPLTAQVPWSKVSNAERYFRVDQARRIIDKYLDQTDNPEMQRAGVASSLQQVRDKLDAGLKKIPEKQLADQIYASAVQARDDFYKGMEIKKGEKVDAPRLAKLFDETKDQGYRWKKAIDQMETLLENYGDQLVPEDKATFLGIVQKSRDLQMKGEQKKFVQGQLWAPGPTGPAVEREAALLQREQRGLRPLTARGAPKDILESPALAINALDEFVGQASAEFYGGRRPGELTKKQKQAISEMFTWRQMNPQADIETEKQTFKSIFEKWGK